MGVQREKVMKSCLKSQIFSHDLKTWLFIMTPWPCQLCTPFIWKPWPCLFQNRSRGKMLFFFGNNSNCNTTSSRVSRSEIFFDTIFFYVFLIEWCIPSKFLCAIYVCFGINQTLTKIYIFLSQKKILINFPCLFSGLEIINQVESVTEWNKPKWTRLDNG